MWLCGSIVGAQRYERQRNFFNSDPATIVNGPPKLVIWDLNTNVLVREYVFSNAVASCTLPLI